MQEEMLMSQEKNWCCLLYVVSCIWIFPLSNFILPLILWLWLRDKSTAFSAHGKNILNFQITWGSGIFLIWLLACFVSCNRSFVFGMTFGAFALMLISSIVVILLCIGAVHAYQGKLFKFLLTYEFIK